MNAQDLYNGLKSGRIMKSQLSKQQISEVYKYMLDSGKVASNDIKPESKQKYNLTDSSKPTVLQGGQFTEYKAPTPKPSFLKDIGYNPNNIPKPDIGYTPPKFTPQYKSTNPENELVDVLSNLSMGDFKYANQPQTSRSFDAPITWQSNPLQAFGKNVSKGFGTLGRAGNNLIDMTLGDRGIDFIDNYLEKSKEYTDRQDAELARINQGTFGQFAGDVSQGIGQAIPFVVESLVAAPYTAATQGMNLLNKAGTQLLSNTAKLANPTNIVMAQKAIKDLVSNPNIIPSLIQGVGMQYEQAINSGATKDQAIKSAIAGGIPSGLIESMGGTENLASKLASKMPFGRTVLESGLGETFEEIMQYPIENLAQKNAFDSDMPYFSMTENAVINPAQQAYNGATAFVSSALMGGVGSGLNKVFEKLSPQEKQIATTIETDLNNIYTAIDNGTPTTETDINTTIEFLQGLEKQYPNLSEYLQGHIEKVDRYREQLKAPIKNEETSIKETTSTVLEPSTNEIQDIEQTLDEVNNIAQNVDNVENEIIDNVPISEQAIEEIEPITELIQDNVTNVTKEDNLTEQTFNEQIKETPLQTIAEPQSNENISNEQTVDEVNNVSQSPSNDVTVSNNETTNETSQPYKMTKEEFKDKAMSNGMTETWLKSLGQGQHKRAIINALIEGKEVPQNVINEYPDIFDEVERYKQLIAEGEVSKEKHKALIEKTNKEVEEAKKQEIEERISNAKQQEAEQLEKYEKSIANRYKQTKKEYVGNKRGKAKELLEYEHRQAIEQALAEGKEVSEEVLKDYPYLIQSNQETNIEANTEPTASKGETNEQIVNEDNNNAEKADTKAEEETKEPLQKVDDLYSKLRKGEHITVDEVKREAQFILNSEETIKAALNKLTIPQLKKMTNSYYAKTKKEFVDAVYNSMVNQLYFNISGKDSITLSFGTDDTIQKQIQPYLDELTQDNLNKLLSDNKTKYEERMTKNREFAEKIKNPVTFEDYSRARNYRKLTPEEQDKYEDLLALDNKQKRENKKVADKEKKFDNATNVLANVDYTIEQSKHTKTGDDIWILKLTDRLEKEQWSNINSALKSLGGNWWSGNKAWNFKIDPTEALKGMAEVKVEDKSKTEKLREVADNMQSVIDDKFATRLTNTAKRAREAASAEDEGRKLQGIQNTLRNIADAIDNGKANLLNKIDSRVQIETLNSMVHRAKYKRFQDTKGIRWEEVRDKPYTNEDVRLAVLPTTNIHENRIKDYAKQIKDKAGYKLLAAKLEKLKPNKDGYVDVSNFIDELDAALKVYDNWLKDDIADTKRLQRMGIESSEELRAYLREYLNYRDGKKEKTKEDFIKEKQREMIGAKIEGYFPTPEAVVNRMLDEANIQETDKVLEPSAGQGHIADKLRDYTDNIDVAEWNGANREILELKEYNVVSEDALSIEGQYDKIVMNPPFEKNQDIKHVMYAYENNLKPGGKLVAIMSEHPFFANDKESVKFREFLEQSGYSEQLPQGSFKESDRSTGVSTRLVVLDKPSERTETVMEENTEEQEVSVQETTDNTKEDIPPQFQGETPALEGEEGYIQLAPMPLSEKFIYDTPELEEQHKKNRIAKESKLNKFRNLASEFKKAATRTFRDLDPKLIENAEIIKELVRFPKLKSIAGDEATRILIDITQRENKELSKEEYSRFERFVFLSDLMEEIKLGHQMPGLWTENSVKSNYTRLEQSLTPNIQEAIKRRKTYWDNVIKDYSKAMSEIGFDVKDKFSKENYFRHQVLEYVNAKQLSGSGGKVKVKTNRGYTKARQGTEKAINEDYLQAEYEVLATMLYDKEVAQMLKRIDENYGIKDQLKAQAKTENALNGTDLTWKDLIPEDYVLWQPIPGKHLFTANTISEKLAEAIINDALDSLTDKDIKVKQILALGIDKEQFVIPSRVAKTLDNIYNKSLQDDIVHKILSYPMSLWKSWVLTVNPRQVIKYNLRNITGDIDGLMAAAGFKAFNPVIVGRASKEMFNALKYGKFTKDLLEFRDRGGFSDLMYAQELGEIYETKKFKIYNPADTNNLIRKAIKKMPGLNTYTDFTENATNFRESIFRYSAYLYFKSDLKKHNGNPTYYGASTRERIDGLKSIEDKAYQLSKDALGSYDEITEFGQVLKKYLIPFHSWNEVNMKRYKRVFENTIKDIKKQEEIGKQVISGLGLVGYTGVHATRLLGKMFIRVFFASALLMAWNRLARPDDDDELPDDIKNTPHLTLGRDENGNIIYFSRLGSLNDVFDWFGLDQIVPDLKEIANERKTTTEQVQDMVISPINKILNSISPFIKTPIELLSNSSYYPDIRQPSTIRDKKYYIFNSLGLGEEYRQFAGLPQQTSYAESWQKALVYKSDPEVNAYYKAIDLKYRFEETILKEQSGRMLGGSEKSEALYYYKQALKYDDEKAAEKYLKMYYDLGGTDKGLKLSLSSLDPMYGLSDKKGEREQFKEWLSEDERKILDRAMKYYEELVKEE